MGTDSQMIMIQIIRISFSREMADISKRVGRALQNLLVMGRLSVFSNQAEIVMGMVSLMARMLFQWMLLRPSILTAMV